MKQLIAIALILLGVCGGIPAAFSQETPAAAAEKEPAPEAVEDEEDPFAKREAKEKKDIADPIEPVNRAFFHFNDKLYFWVLKPVSKGYSAVIPEKGRVCIKNFFSNVRTPIRATNCMLQGDFKGAGNEMARFGINTTVGILGFTDPANSRWDMKKRGEDFGQTLAVWGVGHGFYINWPITGPSSPRDTAGSLMDALFDPVTYVPPPGSTGVRLAERVNASSLTLGEYEKMKDAAVDPYVSLRSAFVQYRARLAKERR